MAKTQAGRVSTRQTQRPVTPLVMLIVALVIVVAGLAFILISANHAHRPANVATVKHTIVVTKTAKAEESSSMRETIRPNLNPTQMELKSRTMPFDPPASAKPCGPQMWSGNSGTSCAFVRTIAARAGVPDIHLDHISFVAHSPVTNKDYNIACRRVETSGWKCTAGDNAVAYIAP